MTESAEFGSTQAFIGSIKEFNMKKGWGHIECEQTHQLYGKDIFLLRSQVNGIVPCKGDQVYFDVADGQRGPEASNVQILSNENGGFIGIMKSWNPVKGWGHVECGPTHTMYGKDIFVLKSAIPGGEINKGDEICFSVVEGTKGVEAANVTVLQSKAGAGLVGGKTQGFVGSIKSFEEEKGWGHIDCAETRELYGKDMFVLRSALNGVMMPLGTKVRFNIAMGAKGPEAREVVIWNGAQGQVIMPPAVIPGMAMRGYQQAPVVGGFQAVGPLRTPQMMMAPAFGGCQAGAANQTLFQGSVKNWNDQKGWGFISCQDTMNIYGKDIFLHVKELNGQQPLAGTPVQFGVAMGADGRPVASQVTLHGGYQAAGGQIIMPRATPY